MQNIVIVTIIFLIVGTILTYVLFKNKLIKEMVCGLIFMTVSLLYCYNLILYWNWYSPVLVIAMIFKPISQIVFGQS